MADINPVKVQRKEEPVVHKIVKSDFGLQMTPREEIVDQETQTKSVKFRDGTTQISGAQATVVNQPKQKI